MLDSTVGGGPNGAHNGSKWYTRFVDLWQPIKPRWPEPCGLLAGVHRLLVAASVVPSSPILVTLMKEALGSSETSVLTRATWRNI
jgi:hypothetical protein